MDTSRCIICGTPACDHVVAIRYPLRAAMRHYLIQKIDVMFRRSR